MSTGPGATAKAQLQNGRVGVSELQVLLCESNLQTCKVLRFWIPITSDGSMQKWSAEVLELLPAGLLEDIMQLEARGRPRPEKLQPRGVAVG